MEFSTAELSSVIDVVALAREIACRMSPDALLDSDDAGSLFKCSGRHFIQRYAGQPGFPKAVRLPNKAGTSYPKWFRCELIEWAQVNRDGTPPPPKGGRPRKKSVD